MVKRYRLIKKRIYRRKRLARRIMRKRRVSRKPGNMGFRPLGLKESAKLKYVELLSVNPALGTPTDYIFSANGCYDPNITGIGHQPYGFDQLMSMYNHYTVVGSRCTLKFASSQSIPMYAGIVLRSDPTPISLTTSELLETPGNKMKLIGYGQSGTSGGPNYMRCNFSTRKFFTKNRGAIIEDFALRGDSAGNPLEQAYYHIILQPQYSSDDLNTQGMTVEIEYSVVFTEPKILGQS